MEHNSAPRRNSHSNKIHTDTDKDRNTTWTTPAVIKVTELIRATDKSKPEQATVQLDNRFNEEIIEDEAEEGDEVTSRLFILCNINLGGHGHNYNAGPKPIKDRLNVRTEI